MSYSTNEAGELTWKGVTAQGWRDMAQDARRRSYESFERCDTDGFLSQAASDASAREYDWQAALLEDGGMDTFPALFDLDGNLVPAKKIETKYGMRWMLIDPENPRGRAVGWFGESYAEDESRAIKTNARKGYYVGTVRVPARAKLGGGWSWTVYSARLDDGWDANAEIIDNGVCDAPSGVDCHQEVGTEESETDMPGMIKTHKLSDAQMNVLTGPRIWNADGSCALTSGRENTLAALRRLGILNGRLLTRHGNNVRLSAENGERSVYVPVSGESETFYAPAVTGETAPEETATPVAAPAAPVADPHRRCEHRKTLTADHAQDCPVWTDGAENRACECWASDANCEELSDGPVAPVQCTEGHPVADGVEVNAVGMCMPCVREGQAKLRAEYDANLIKWQAEADAKRAEEDATMRAQSERMETVLADVLAGYSAVTDADLSALAARGSAGASGPIREAEILSPLTPRVRALVRAEGMVWMNTHTGWDWSGSLYEARRNVLAGKTPGRELNARLMAYDPTGERAVEAAANGHGWDGFVADAHTAAPVDPDAFDMSNLTDVHVIMYMGDDRAVCGETVSRAQYGESTLRVSVDPTDATCSECITLEAQRAALDALVPDEEAMVAAYVQAVQNGEADADAPMILTAPDADDRPTAEYDAHMIHPDYRRPGGMVQIPGLPEGTVASLPPVVRVERQGRFLVATVTVLGTPETFRTANGPKGRQLVETWARTRGVRPSAKGWSWTADGDALVAPVVLI